MSKIKRLANPVNTLLDISPPTTFEEFELRTKQYDLLEPKKFKSLFQKGIYYKIQEIGLISPTLITNSHYAFVNIEDRDSEISYGVFHSLKLMNRIRGGGIFPLYYNQKGE